MPDDPIEPTEIDPVELVTEGARPAYEKQPYDEFVQLVNGTESPESTLAYTQLINDAFELGRQEGRSSVNYKLALEGSIQFETDPETGATRVTVKPSPVQPQPATPSS